MARIAGVNIPDNKHAKIALTYIFGIGRTKAVKICAAAGVDPVSKISALDEANLDAIRTEVAKETVEGEQLAREIAPFILRKINRRKIPLMISLLTAILKNKKLKIF